MAGTHTHLPHPPLLSSRRGHEKLKNKRGDPEHVGLIRRELKGFLCGILFLKKKIYYMINRMRRSGKSQSFLSLVSENSGYFK